MSVDLPDTDIIETINVDVSLRRCGGETRLVINGDHPQIVSADSTASIQSALLNGLKWNQELRIGNFKSIAHISVKEGVTRQYVARLMELAYLAPEIMNLIVNGDVPDTLTLEKLKSGFPLDWEQQASFFKLT